METKPIPHYEKVIASFFNALSQIDVSCENDSTANDLLNEFTAKYMDTSPYLLTERDIRIFNFYFEILGYSNSDKILILKAFLQKEIVESAKNTQ